MDTETRIKNRIAELIQTRAQVVDNILRNHPDVRAIDAAIGELKAIIEAPPSQDKPAEQPGVQTSTGNE